MTGVFEAFLAGIYAEIKMVTRLSAAAAAMAGTDTDKVRGSGCADAEPFKQYRIQKLF